MKSNNKDIARHQENIQFDQRQIEFYEREMKRVEHAIKLWRVFKMVDELFLWYELKQNFYLYNKQYTQLKNIQNKLEEQF